MEIYLDINTINATILKINKVVFLKKKKIFACIYSVF